MRKVVFLLIAIFVLLMAGRPVLSVECQSTDVKDSETLQKIIDACNNKLGELSEQRNTLASQIEYMDTQISVTELEINQNKTEIQSLKKEIKSLSSRIGELNSTTDKISDVVKLKIEEMYKRQQTGFVYTLLGANNLPKFLRSIQYLRRSQISDRELLLKLQNTKVTYEEQKDLREEKEEELNQLTEKLESYKIELASQQQAKEQLLTITKNDEARYQQLLTRLKAEYQAIQAIVMGGGTETEIKQVSNREKIATVIQGDSCNSNGTHLHFTVIRGNEPLNPFSYLKPIDYSNCSGPGECSAADPFNPSGDWEWPLNGPIRMNQGYGNTWAVQNNSWIRDYYTFHNGIDIVGSSLDVFSVAEGTLFRGSYVGGGGCALPYVRVNHEGSDLSTLYLHVYGI
jgi:peptidoglycan hydrolase CwlO-like protein